MIIVMYIKVDYSEDCKKNGFDVSRPGAYAIYTRKHFWNRWVQCGCGYSDLEWCKRDAKKMNELPIYYI